MGNSPDGKWYLVSEGQEGLRLQHRDGQKHQPRRRATRSASSTRRTIIHTSSRPTASRVGRRTASRCIAQSRLRSLQPAARRRQSRRTSRGGIGDAQQIRFRLVRLDRPAVVDAAVVAVAADSVARGNDERRRHRPLEAAHALGVRRVDEEVWLLHRWQPVQTPTPLIYADKAIGGAEQGREGGSRDLHRADVHEFPDYWVSDTAFASPTQGHGRESDSVSEYAWGSKSADRLQELAKASGCRAR